jgi:predicted component of type VI protein secretion system
VLLCSCSLGKAKEPDVYPQPRLVETARNPQQESPLSVPSVPSDLSDKSDRPVSGTARPVPSAPDPDWNRQEQTRSTTPALPAPFTLSIKADAGLNRFRNSAHALHLCLYQLKEPNGLRQLGEEREGVARLMECARFDGSVAHAGRMVVQPGARITEMRERAEGVRYLGIVTGYYGSPKQKTVKIVPLPQHGAVGGETVSIELGPGAIEKITVD